MIVLIGYINKYKKIKLYYMLIKLKVSYKIMLMIIQIHIYYN